MINEASLPALVVSNTNISENTIKINKNLFISSVFYTHKIVYKNVPKILLQNFAWYTTVKNEI